MLRWLSFFGAVALVVAGVVFYLHGGPPPTLIAPPPVGKPIPPAGQPAKADELPPPVQGGPWTRVVAVTPRVIIPGARLTALLSPQVPSMRDGQLLFLGTEIKVKPTEQPPAGAFQAEMNYLVTEVQAGEKGPQEDWVTIDGKWYRPLGKREEVRPNKVRLYFADKWFLPIDEGSRVEKDQLLALIDPSLAVDELSSKLAKFEAAESDRVASEAIKKFEYERMQRLEGLKARGAATQEEVSEARAGYERYYQETISKGMQVKVAARELRQSETILEQHQIRSKIKGEVKQLIKHKSESVKNLDSVLEMVDISKLRIRGRFDLQDRDSLPDPRNPEDKRVLYVEATRLVGPRRVLTGHMGEVTGVAVSSDGQIVSVSEDRRARVWLKDQGRERLVLEHPAPVRAVACTAPKTPRNLCLTGAADGVARLYDLAADKDAFVGQFTNGHKEAINSVAFSPDGRWAVSGGDDRRICLWDVDNAKLLQLFPEDWGHHGGVTSVTFLAVGAEEPQKLSVVSAGRDNALLVWPLNADGTTGKPTRLDRRGGEVTTLGVSPDGQHLLFDQGKELRLLSSDNYALAGSLSATAAASFSKLALFSPDGKLVLASGGAGHLGLWRAPTAQTRGHELEQLVWTSSRDEQAVTNCGAFAPDSSFLVTGTQSRNVIVWPMPKPEVVTARLIARVINLDPEVSSGQVRLTAEIDNPNNYLLPGDVVTLVVYPEK